MCNGILNGIAKEQWGHTIKGRRGVMISRRNGIIKSIKIFIFNVSPISHKVDKTSCCATKGTSLA